MISKFLRPSVILLALTVSIAPASRMYADDPCNVVTGCDPVPPPAAAAPSLVSIILSVFGLS